MLRGVGAPTGSTSVSQPRARKLPEIVRAVSSRMTRAFAFPLHTGELVQTLMWLSQVHCDRSRVACQVLFPEPSILPNPDGNTHQQADR